MIAPAHHPHAHAHAHEQNQDQKIHHGAAEPRRVPCRFHESVPIGQLRTRKAGRLLSACLLLAAVAFVGVSCGGGGSAAINTAVVPAPSGPPGSPSAPSGVVLDHVEEAPWLTCGNCGNSNGGTAASYSSKRGIASPSEDGSSTEFSIASARPFTNGYFFQEHAPVSTAMAALTYEFDIYIAPGMENLPQAIEFECQQKLNGWVYNFSWQAVYPSDTWRIFDYSLKRWDDTGVPFAHFAPGVWHHVAAEFHNDTAAHRVIHDALTVDGARQALNISHNAFHSGAVGEEFTNAIQLDINAAHSAYSIYIDKMKINYR